MASLAQQSPDGETNFHLWRSIGAIATYKGSSASVSELLQWEFIHLT